MHFPIGDWQFWVVSFIALAGLLFILKPLWPSRDRSGGCILQFLQLVEFCVVMIFFDCHNPIRLTFHGAVVWVATS